MVGGGGLCRGGLHLSLSKDSELRAAQEGAGKKAQGLLGQ